MLKLFTTRLSLSQVAAGPSLRILASAVFVAITTAVMTGCAAPSGQAGDAVGPGSSKAKKCKISENLLVDTAFTRRGEFAQAWRKTQHAGEPSFSTKVTGGVLEIRLIATQPWMLFRQTVKDPRLSGATIRYSAELKGDLPDEPRLHGFDHIGGLYLKVGRDKVRLADHEPNSNQWDWQAFSYEEVIPSGVTSLRAGFVHQSGGALWAKNPSLVILDCP